MKHTALIFLILLSNISLCVAQENYIPTEEEKQDTLHLQSASGERINVSVADFKQALMDAVADYDPAKSRMIAKKALIHKLYKFTKAERDSIWDRAEQQELKWKIRDNDSLRIALESSVKAKDPRYTHTIVPYIRVRDWYDKTLSEAEVKRRIHRTTERYYQYTDECDTLAAYALRNKCFRFTKKEKQAIINERMQITLQHRIDEDSTLYQHLEKEIDSIEDAWVHQYEKISPRKRERIWRDAKKRFRKKFNAQLSIKEALQNGTIHIPCMQYVAEDSLYIRAMAYNLDDYEDDFLRLELKAREQLCDTLYARYGLDAYYYSSAIKIACTHKEYDKKLDVVVAAVVVEISKQEISLIYTKHILEQQVQRLYLERARQLVNNSTLEEIPQSDADVYSYPCVQKASSDSLYIRAVGFGRNENLIDANIEAHVSAFNYLRAKIIRDHGEGAEYKHCPVEVLCNQFFQQADGVFEVMITMQVLRTDTRPRKLQIHFDSLFNES